MSSVMYEMATQARNLFNLAEQSENPEEALQHLQEIQGKLEQRVEWAGLRCLELGHEEDAYSTEIERLTRERDRVRHQQAWLRSFIGIVLARADIKRVDGTLVKVWRQRVAPSVLVSSSLEQAVIEGIDLREVFDTRFVRVVPERTEIDKKGLIENFKATGEIPDGVEIDDTRESIRIK